MPLPSAKKFDYTIEWYMLRLTDGIPIAWYPLYTSVSNTNALKLHLNITINRAKTGNYTFIEPRAQKVQSQGQVSAPTPCRGRCTQTILRQSKGVTLIDGMQPVRVPYNNAEDDKKEDGRSRYDRNKLDKEGND